MKVTLLTPAAIEASAYTIPEGSRWDAATTYAVAAPDGLYFFDSFEVARTFALSYDLPVSLV